MPSFDKERRVEFEDVRIESVTDLSVWAIIEGKRINIPQSQIDDDSEVWKAGDEGTLIVSLWIAEQKGLV